MDLFKKHTKLGFGSPGSALMVKTHERNQSVPRGFVPEVTALLCSATKTT